MPLNMGRGTDTRMYNPHSESSYMFRDNDEDQEKYGRGDSEFHEEKTMRKRHVANYKTKGWIRYVHFHSQT